MCIRDSSKMITKNVKQYRVIRQVLSEYAKTCSEACNSTESRCTNYSTTMMYCTKFISEQINVDTAISQLETMSKLNGFNTSFYINANGNVNTFLSNYFSDIGFDSSRLSNLIKTRVMLKYLELVED